MLGVPGFHLADLVVVIEDSLRRRQAVERYKRHRDEADPGKQSVISRHDATQRRSGFSLTLE